ncbi:ABC transporter [Anaerocolumna cellulosilytica]|uniref:ABC transporter n=1 Tax=Anaerocolumna cellulosilytica TaxID=433286 RepID=A0A6S6RDB7_9FIRM|nr:ATP-binding cassette domain-containing protein [Anaerocolumna cellulosilytica]MBB5195324.1 multidrug/hemolysin transport system ATP-binding protein [Anaerocolumna cellulosilytica]BCJ96798.1 ABC transporter [Anaerocolumna cellulosilytica]
MEEIIKVKHLKKHFKDIRAVDDISFQVKKGELYGFLGINGAGKSTTINILCTLLDKTEGEVTICGYTLGKENEAIRRKIGVVFQDNMLDGRLTIKENLLVRGSLYFKDSKIVQKNMEQVCEILGIGELLNRQFRKLSGGQKRRCEIARALIHTPEILFLDEPTTGLDPQTRQNVWECIEALQRENDMTVFLTTHYMEEAGKASHISIMDIGKIVAAGAPHELKAVHAHDIVKLYPKSADTVTGYLSNNGYNFTIKNNHIQVDLKDTLAGIGILKELEGVINGCEILQGTMDDVFLNITGRKL